MLVSIAQQSVKCDQKHGWLTEGGKRGNGLGTVDNLFHHLKHRYQIFKLGSMDVPSLGMYP